MPKGNAVIAGTPYRGSLMPMGGGTFCLGVLKPIQEAAGVGDGDSITIDLELDTAPRTVELPADLARAVAQDKQPNAAWEALAYTNKKEIARSLEEAKRPETGREDWPKRWSRCTRRAKGSAAEDGDRDSELAGDQDCRRVKAQHERERA